MSDGEQTRRQHERDAANARFGVELTRVDQALPSVSADSPGVPVELDTRALRTRAAMRPQAPAVPGGWRGWLARFINRLVAPEFERQQELNTLIVEHLASVGDAVRQVAAAVPAAGAADRETLRAFLTFHSALVVCLQQIAPFVDTKVRAVEGTLDEIRMAASAAQRSAAALSRQLESGSSPAFTTARPGATPGDLAIGGVGGHTGQSPLTAQYVGFEDLFRGSEQEIRARQIDYVDYFVGAPSVVDLGCGRGEFLALLRERGIEAIGVDANPDMVDACRLRGLRAFHGDALDYLGSVADESLGGVIALQVVEHLEPDRLVRLLAASHAKLRPGGTIVLETINVACWVADFESYIRDITHVRPLHPDTLKFLVVAAGFANVDVHFRSPVAAEGRLRMVDVNSVPPQLADLARTVNLNVETLNGRLFTSLDYAIVGTKSR